MENYLVGALVGVFAIYGYARWMANRPQGQHPRSSEIVSQSAFR